MARAYDWAQKVLALARGGNTAAAIAHIKVAPTVKDLKTLQRDVAAAQLTGRWRDMDTAISDNLDLLSAPRLHRSP